MSSTMAAHEPIKYLDSILNEEETRCEYSHEWRNFTISRSGRFKSKNKKRDAVNRKLFDTSEKKPDETITITNGSYKEQEKITARQTATTVTTKDFNAFHQQAQTSKNSSARVRDKVNNYMSYRETNL